METPDFKKAHTAAVNLLLFQRLYRLPLDVECLHFSQHVLFDSVRHFCDTTRTTITQLTEYSGCLEDGCTLILRKGGQPLYVVLYNEQKPNLRRRRFTLAHEVGHICLQHDSDGDVQEAEANCFAAELLMPSVLIRYLFERSVSPPCPADLAELFGVSVAAAEVHLRRLSREAHDTSPVEEILLKKLTGLLPVELN